MNLKSGGLKAQLQQRLKDYVQSKSKKKRGRQYKSDPKECGRQIETHSRFRSEPIPGTKNRRVKETGIIFTWHRLEIKSNGKRIIWYFCGCPSKDEQGVTCNKLVTHQNMMKHHDRCMDLRKHECTICAAKWNDDNNKTFNGITTIYKFNDKKDLKQHMQAKHGENGGGGWTCSICKPLRAFSRESSLKHHMNVKHPNQPSLQLTQEESDDNGQEQEDYTSGDEESDNGQDNDSDPDYDPNYDPSNNKNKSMKKAKPTNIKRITLNLSNNNYNNHSDIERDEQEEEEEKLISEDKNVETPKGDNTASQLERSQKKHSIVRLVYVHAARKVTDAFKQDQYHIDLLKNVSNIKFRNDEPNDDDQERKYKIVEDLPNFGIVGFVLFCDGIWFDKNNDQHMNQQWMVGPFCLKIVSDNKYVFRLSEKVECKGSQNGRFTVPSDILDKIQKQDQVLETINEWKKDFDTFITESPIAITVSPPIAEAIISGHKKYENRKKRLFHLHDNKAVHPWPEIPTSTQCRFCPDDPSKCTYWLHGNNNNISKKQGVKRKTNDKFTDEPPRKKMRVKRSTLKVRIGAHGNNNNLTGHGNNNNVKKRDWSFAFQAKEGSVIDFRGNRAEILEIDYDEQSALLWYLRNGQKWKKFVDLAFEYEEVTEYEEIQKFKKKIKQKQHA